MFRPPNKFSSACIPLTDPDVMPAKSKMAPFFTDAWYRAASSSFDSGCGGCGNFCLGYSAGLGCNSFSA